jgi:glyoxylate reductase
LTSQRPRVYVTRGLPGDALERLARVAEIVVWPGQDPPDHDELSIQAGSSDGLITLLTDNIDSSLLQRVRGRLRVVSNVATGYDNIDVATATACGIAVTNTPGVLEETTADLTFALLLAVARRVSEGDRMIRENAWTSWSPTLLLGMEVHGATLGIVGLGAIGKAVARRARGFDMRVVYYSRSRKPDVEKELGLKSVDLDTLLETSDFVSLHAPLNNQTRRLIGPRELSLMRPTAYLVNTARGGLIDQGALCEALNQGAIAGAGLDVFEEEPLPSSDRLRSLTNVVLTPHIGSASAATRSRMAAIAVENCLSVLAGESPAHCINPEVLSRNTAVVR